MAYKIPKRKAIANENIYYKENRAIIKVGNRYYLRNTWTGEEMEVSKSRAKGFKKEWKQNKVTDWV